MASSMRGRSHGSWEINKAKKCLNFTNRVPHAPYKTKSCAKNSETVIQENNEANIAPQTRKMKIKWKFVNITDSGNRMLINDFFRN